MRTRPRLAEKNNKKYPCALEVHRINNFFFYRSRYLAVAVETRFNGRGGGRVLNSEMEMHFSGFREDTARVFPFWFRRVSITRYVFIICTRV